MTSENLYEPRLMAEIEAVYYDIANQDMVRTMRSTENGLYVEPRALDYCHKRLLNLVFAGHEMAKANPQLAVDADYEPIWVPAIKSTIKNVRHKFSKYSRIDERAHLFSEASEAAKLNQAQLCISALFHQANQRFDDVYLA